MLVFSEFGRRLAENAGAGTDHGTAAPVFLLGPGVRGGLHGPHPDLRDLDDGDPKFTRRLPAGVRDRARTMVGLPRHEGPARSVRAARPVRVRVRTLNDTAAGR